MQEQTSSSLSALLPNVGDTTTLKDSRDDQKYTVGKLADGKYWMTENLNLAGGTALSASDTDVTSTYISSFTTSNNLTKSGNTIILPASSTSGFNSNNYSFVYNSDNKTNCGARGQNTPCYSYYSWDAATLGSGRTIATDNTDAEQSICPKGWRLPTSGNWSNNEWKRGDFYALATAYGANLESSHYDASSATGANFYNNAGPGTIPNFLLAGYRSGGTFNYGGTLGYYWSSTSYSSTYYARYLRLHSSNVYSTDNGSREYGYSVRCLFKSSTNSTQSSTSPQSITPNQSPASAQSVTNTTSTAESTPIEPTRSTMSAASQGQSITKDSTQDDTTGQLDTTTNTTNQSDTTTDTTNSSDTTTNTTNSSDTTTNTTDPSSTTTSPHGVVSTESPEADEEKAAATRTALTVAATTSAVAGTLFFILAKRKANEDDDTDIHPTH